MALAKMSAVIAMKNLAIAPIDLLTTVPRDAFAHAPPQAT
jgi:hypothetical protein